MRGKTYLFTVNGLPMLIPDEEVTVNYEDLDAADSGRDESGVLHRFVVRSKVATWGFSYSYLTEEEKQYMEGLFQSGATFSFGHPSRTDGQTQEVSTCYRSKYGISYKNAVTGIWKNYVFNIIEC